MLNIFKSRCQLFLLNCHIQNITDACRCSGACTWSKIGRMVVVVIGRDKIYPIYWAIRNISNISRRSKSLLKDFCCECSKQHEKLLSFFFSWQFRNGNECYGVSLSALQYQNTHFRMYWWPHQSVWLPRNDQYPWCRHRQIPVVANLGLGCRSHHQSFERKIP